MSGIETEDIIVKEPTIARRLFSEAGPWSFVWLVARLYIGWQWLHAGLEKILGIGAHPWGPEALLGFWKHAVAVPETGNPLITYDWYRAFLQVLINIKAETWFSHVIAYGEFLVGAALILGAFVGIAAALGAFMNFNFMLAGTASINPVLMLVAILLMMAWKTAGWWGLDRWLLPNIGVPWSRVKVKKER